MFRAISIIQDPSTASAFEMLAQQTELVALIRNFTYHPRLHELNTAVAGSAADIVFVELSDREESITLLEGLRMLGQPIAVIGFGAGWTDGAAEEFMAAGVTEMMPSPVTPAMFSLSVQKAIRKVRDTVQENLMAFLPAKAGSGCTTIALNTAGCLASQLGKKVLLIESDLNSGVLAIMLGLKPVRSVLDVLENSNELNFSTWNSCIQRSNGIDILCATRSRPLPSWTAYHHLLEFAKTRYDHIIVDLPEVVNEATSEIFLRAKYTFVVATPEILSMTLAQRRCQDLENRSIVRERIGIIVNRWHETDKSEREIEATLDHGVAAIIPNEYAVIQKANETHQLVNKDTAIGHELLAFSKRLAGIFEPDETPLPTQKKSKPLEFLMSLTGRK